MCAVYVRDQIGTGQHIDISIQEIMAGQYESIIEHWTLAENEMGGLTNPIIQPMIPLECQDGWIFLMCVEDDQFDRMVEVMSATSGTLPISGTYENSTPPMVSFGV